MKKLALPTAFLAGCILTAIVEHSPLRSQTATEATANNQIEFSIGRAIFVGMLKRDAVKIVGSKACPESNVPFECVAVVGSTAVNGTALKRQDGTPFQALVGHVYFDTQGKVVSIDRRLDDFPNTTDLVDALDNMIASSLSRSGSHDARLSASTRESQPGVIQRSLTVEMKNHIVIELLLTTADSADADPIKMVEINEMVGSLDRNRSR